MTDQTKEPTGEDLSTTAAPPPEPPTVDETTTKLEKLTTSFSIWPPSQRTRDAVIKRLIDTLSEKSVLSDRYGVVPSDEAAGIARLIEQEAFDAVPASPGADGDDGVEILQSYSKEISKRMLEFVKSRSVESGKDGEKVETGVKDEENEKENSNVEG